MSEHRPLYRIKAAKDRSPEEARMDQVGKNFSSAVLGEVLTRIAISAFEKNAESKLGKEINGFLKMLGPYVQPHDTPYNIRLATKGNEEEIIMERRIDDMRTDTLYSLSQGTVDDAIGKGTWSKIFHGSPRPPREQEEVPDFPIVRRDEDTFYRHYMSEFCEWCDGDGKKIVQDWLDKLKEEFPHIREFSEEELKDLKSSIEGHLYLKIFNKIHPLVQGTKLTPESSANFEMFSMLSQSAFPNYGVGQLTGNQKEMYATYEGILARYGDELGGI